MSWVVIFMKGMMTAVIGIAVVVAATIIIVGVTEPVIEKSQATQRYIDAKQLMHTLNDLIKELSLEADGSKRVITEVVEGDIIVEGSANRLRMKIPSDVKFLDSTSIKDGDLTIVSGPYIRAYESDIDKDGSTDLVMENDALLFAVKKIGNSSNFTQIDTSSIVSLMKNKRSGVSAVPVTRITINERRSTSSGNGFTELLDKGDFLNTGSIKVTVNSTDALYESIFTLEADRDFIEFKVVKVTLK